jgi:formate hydrogenlyase transcriptional activator
MSTVLARVGETTDALNSTDGSEFTFRANVFSYLPVATRDPVLPLKFRMRFSTTLTKSVGNSAALKHVLKVVEKVAPFDSTVLLLGETGTGKELIAQAVHRASPRCNRAFVRVNCASLPAELIASELFGHEKGAFTGALQQRIGRFELANGGTIFLDEIAELSPEIQVSLLRVLQEKEFERVGGNRTIKTDVRVIAATNKDLWREVTEGRFRMDLFYRLNVFPLLVPPLRERVKDIPILVDYFVARVAGRAGKRISHIEERSLCAMQEYSWPGNIRELQNVIERCVILAEGDVLRVEPSMLMHDAIAIPRAPGIGSDRKVRIETVLRETRGKFMDQLALPLDSACPRPRSIRKCEHWVSTSISSNKKSTLARGLRCCDELMLELNQEIRIETRLRPHTLHSTHLS